MIDGKPNHRQKFHAILKAAMYGGATAALLEIVIIGAVVYDWGHSAGHSLMTDDAFIIGFILSIPALALERILGLDAVGGLLVYSTAFLNIILCALTFATIASVWQFILRRKV